MKKEPKKVFKIKKTSEILLQQLLQEQKKTNKILNILSSQISLSLLKSKILTTQETQELIERINTQI